MIILKISALYIAQIKRSLFKVSKVGLKAPKFGVKSKLIWFLGLYISGSTNPRKLLFFKLVFQSN